MGKRILAFLCTLAMLLGMFVVPATAADTAEDTLFEVGYSKKDLNPWVDYTDPVTGKTLGIKAADVTSIEYITTLEIDEYDGSEFTENKIPVNFLKVPSAGTGNLYLADLVDDNGDGYIGYGDGVFVTCTSVTDSTGKTVFYISLDGLKIYGPEATDIRDEIIKAMDDDGIIVDESQIMITASHAHASPSYTSCKGSSDSTIRAYYDYVINQITAAAVDAYGGRSKAVMSKGQIDASDSMKAKGYTDSNDDGWRLNFSRHYNITSILASAKVTDDRWRTDWEYVKDIELIATPYSGRPFIQVCNNKYPNEQYVYEKGEIIYQTNCSMPESDWEEDYALKYISHVSEADDVLYVLRFQPTNQLEKPIVLINWRAHATMNGSGGSGLSSDYINALRYRLENNSKFSNDENAQDYCVGFWQGAAGNIVSSSDIDAENGWKNEVALPDVPENNTAKYGYLLALVSLDCLDSEMEKCAAGTIATKRVMYSRPNQTYDAGLHAAAESNEFIIENGSPYSYTYNDEEVYVVNSAQHQHQIKQNRSGTTDIELNVIALGTDVAMVIVPGEPFDRYSDEYVDAYDAVVDGLTDRWEIAAAVEEKWDDLVEEALKHNDWEELVGGTYGTPFVLGYATQDIGYLAEAMAYDYNTFGKDNILSQIYGPGSYEGNVAYLAKGSGEAIIDKLGEMLNEITAVDANIGDESYRIGEAISKYDGSAPIKLVQDIKTEVTVNRNVTIDLNGYDIDKVIIEDGCTLQCMDSTTDVAIYTGEYGMIKDVDRKGSGKLEGVPATATADGHSYLMLSEERQNGDKINYSFHDVYLFIYSMTMRPYDENAGKYNPGIYYQCKIYGDDMVAEAINNNGSYGIALSIQGQPTAENMETQCQYSVSTETFTAGMGGTEVNSVLLRGIMKDTNPGLINSRNAEFKIYGSAYIKVGDQVVFGICKAPTLKDMFVGNADEGIPDGVDAKFSQYGENDKNAILALYETYEPIMKSWKIPNIKDAYEEKQ